MRVSTSMIFNSGVGGMRDLQSGLYKLPKPVGDRAAHSDAGG